MEQAYRETGSMIANRRRGVLLPNTFTPATADPPTTRSAEKFGEP
jgi:hypothetical protein